MKQLQDTVVRPVIQQVAIRDEEIAKLKTQVTQLQQSLKMLHAVVRSPLLSEKYAKQVR